MTLVIYIGVALSVGDLPEDVAKELERRGWELGCLYSIANGMSPGELKKCRYVLIDQGIAAAKRELSDVELWRWYTRAVKRVKVAVLETDVKVVAPDVFGSMERTAERWEKWAPRIESMGVAPLLVLQEPKRIAEWIKTKAYRDARAVAIPSRELYSIKCARRPRLCAEVIAAVADVAEDKEWIHLLGAGLGVLGILAPLLGRKIHSFDTTAYRMAVSDEVRIRKTPDEPGLWMVTRGLEREFFIPWLRRLLQRAGRP